MFLGRSTVGGKRLEGAVYRSNKRIRLLVLVLGLLVVPHTPKLGPNLGEAFMHSIMRGIRNISLVNVNVVLRSISLLNLMSKRVLLLNGVLREGTLNIKACRRDRTSKLSRPPVVLVRWVMVTLNVVVQATATVNALVWFMATLKVPVPAMATLNVLVQVTATLNVPGQAMVTLNVLVPAMVTLSVLLVQATVTLNALIRVMAITNGLATPAMVLDLQVLALTLEKLARLTRLSAVVRDWQGR
jgi:hypothetical protein